MESLDLIPNNSNATSLARRAIQLLRVPDALPTLFKKIAPVSRAENQDLLELAYYLLARPRLYDLDVRIALPSRGLPQVLTCAAISAAVAYAPNVTPVPARNRRRCENAYKGFEEFFDSHNDPYRKEAANYLDLIGGPVRNTFDPSPEDEDEEALFKIALDFLLNPLDATLNSSLPDEERLHAYLREEPSEETEHIIKTLYALVNEVFGGSLRFTQIISVYEVIAFMRRIERDKWQVQREDVLKAWRYSGCLTKWPHIIENKNQRIILTTINNKNKSGADVSQRGVQRITGLGWKFITKELKMQEGEQGRSIVAGYVEVRNPSKKYRITSRGQRAIADDYSIDIDGVTYRMGMIDA
jgi:hypothetical protein